MILVVLVIFQRIVVSPVSVKLPPVFFFSVLFLLVFFFPFRFQVFVLELLLKVDILFL